jgi:hypothetical protein
VTRVRRLALLPLAGVAFVAAGCGGGGGIDKGKLEGAMKRGLEARSPQQSITGVTCTKKGDAYHFDCTAAVEDGSLLYLTAECNSREGGSCEWRVTRKG